jgi:hypothetical protein
MDEDAQIQAFAAILQQKYNVGTRCAFGREIMPL